MAFVDPISASGSSNRPAQRLAFERPRHFGWFEQDARTGLR